MVPDCRKAAGAGRRARVLPALALLVWSLTACAPASQVAAPPPAPKVHVVVIEKFRFEPPTLPLRPGDQVRWENRDIVPHRIADNSLRKWESPDLKPGQSFSLKVEETSPYICLLHPTMEGRIEIRVD